MASKGRKKKTQSKPVTPSVTGKRTLPLSEVRRRLSPLVKSISGQDAVGISVRGEVRAYLVPAESYDQEQRRARIRAFPIRGSLKWIGNPEDVPKAIKQAREEATAALLKKWDERLRE
jgi:prevent-host-death family protein